jgi:hypothetical protein
MAWKNNTPGDCCCGDTVICDACEDGTFPLSINITFSGVTANPVVGPIDGPLLEAIVNATHTITPAFEASECGNTQFIHTGPLPGGTGQIYSISVSWSVRTTFGGTPIVYAVELISTVGIGGGQGLNIWELSETFTDPIACNAISKNLPYLFDLNSPIFNANGLPAGISP